MDALAISLPRKRKRGGQPGNLNALKTGLHRAHIRAFVARVRNWKRRSRALLKLVDAELSLRSALAAQNLDRLGVNARVATSQNSIAIDQRLAVPIGDD